MLVTCSQMLYVNNKATQLLTIADLRLPKHYLHMGIMLIRRRSRRTYLHQLICEIGIQKDKGGNCISLIHLYLHSINHIRILTVLILH
jgi:hypothetical protein